MHRVTTEYLFKVTITTAHISSNGSHFSPAGFWDHTTSVKLCMVCFYVLCSLLNVLAHHLWVQFSKSTLLYLFHQIFVPKWKGLMTCILFHLNASPGWELHLLYRIKISVEIHSLIKSTIICKLSELFKHYSCIGKGLLERGLPCHCLVKVFIDDIYQIGGKI